MSETEHGSVACDLDLEAEKAMASLAGKPRG